MGEERGGERDKEGERGRGRRERGEERDKEGERGRGEEGEREREVTRKEGRLKMKPNVFQYNNNIIS